MAKKLDIKELSEIHSVQLIEDGHDLTDGEVLIGFNSVHCNNSHLVISESHVNNNREGFSTDDIWIYNSKKLINPPSNSIVVNSNQFEFTLYTKLVEDSNFFGQPPWSVFYTDSVKVETNGFINKNGRSIQRFQIRLNENKPYGLLQLKCNAELVNIEDDTFIKDNFYNLYVAASNRIFYPPIIPIRPLFKQTWIPLKKHQEVQVIAGPNEKIVYHHDNIELKKTHVDFSRGDKYKIEYYETETEIQETNALIIEYDSKRKDKTRTNKKVIYFPEIKNEFAVLYLFPEIDCFAFFCHNTKGLIVRTQRPLRPKKEYGYLDKGYRLYLNSMVKHTSSINGVVYYDHVIELHPKGNSLFTKVFNLFNENECKVS
jgi:hypothetical protein